MACKSAEAREHRARSDLKRASHGEDLFTVAETRFGENWKFSSSGERLWLISGGWLADDLAELVTGSIYRQLRRWCLIQPGSASGRR